MSLLDHILSSVGEIKGNGAGMTTFPQEFLLAEATCLDGDKNNTEFGWSMLGRSIMLSEYRHDRPIVAKIPPNSYL